MNRLIAILMLPLFTVAVFLDVCLSVLMTGIKVGIQQSIYENCDYWLNDQWRKP